MKSIYIKNGNILEIFNEFKNNLKGTLTTSDQNYNIDVKSKIAIGKIEATSFDRDISYLQFDIVFHDDVRISLESSNDLPIFFTYCSKGGLQHSFGEQGYKKTLKEQQTGILRSNSNTNSILHFKKNIPVNFSIIRIGLNKAKSLHNEELIKRIKNVFFRTKSDYLEVRPFDNKIMERLNELHNIGQKGIVRNLLRNRIVQNIVEIEIEQHIDLLSQFVQTMNSFTLKKVDEVKRVSNTFTSLSTEVFTTDCLIQKMRLSTNKLQKEFKFILNRPLHDFLIFIRIERGRI